MNIHEVEGFQGYDVVWTVNIGVVCDYSLLNKEKNMSTSAWWKYIIKLKKKKWQNVISVEVWKKTRLLYKYIWINCEYQGNNSTWI